MTFARTEPEYYYYLSQCCIKYDFALKETNQHDYSFVVTRDYVTVYFFDHNRKGCVRVEAVGRTQKLLNLIKSYGRPFPLSLSVAYSIKWRVFFMIHWSVSLVSALRVHFPTI